MTGVPTNDDRHASHQVDLVEPVDPVDAIGALAEPNRRALYAYVVEQRGWVSRDQAAAAVGLQRGIAAHHLDRLADEGLLEIDYQRLNQRRGPGAGRPAKLYRRTTNELGVSLPPRDYELIGRLLADAVDRSRRDGTPIEQAIDRAARDHGRALGAEARRALAHRAGVRARRARLLGVLQLGGFEPEARGDGVIVLHNCPFHRLAEAHTDLVCTMNLSLLESLVDELDGSGLHAELEPSEGCCCVRLHDSTA